MGREAIYLFLVKVISALLGFFIIAVISKNLSSEVVGSYMFLIALSNTIIPFSLMGLGHHLLSDVDKFNSNALTFSLVILISSIILTLCVSFYLFYFEEFELNLLIVFLVVTVLASLSDYFSYIYQFFRKAWVGGGFLLNLRQIIFLLFLIFWSSEIDLYSIFLALAFSSIVGLSAGIFYFLKMKFELCFKFEIGYIWTSIRQAKDFFVSHVIGTFNGNLLPLYVGAFLGTTHVAYFGIALKIVALSSFVLVPLNRVIAPRYAKSFKSENTLELTSNAKFSARMALLFAIPFTLFISINSEFVLSFFGDEYSIGAKSILLIMLVGQFVNIASGSVGWLLQMTGSAKFYRNLSIVNFVFLVLFTPFSIIFLGLKGAAISYSFSLVFMNLISAFVVYKRLGINIYNFIGVKND